MSSYPLKWTLLQAKPPSPSLPLSPHLSAQISASPRGSPTSAHSGSPHVDTAPHRGGGLCCTLESRGFHPGH